MTKAKAKEQPALFEQQLLTTHVEIREGKIKKNTNPPPTTERPPAPKSQVVAGIDTGGWYTINLAATDTNGDVIALEFAATGAAPTGIVLITEP